MALASLSLFSKEVLYSPRGTRSIREPSSMGRNSRHRCHMTGERLRIFRGLMRLARIP